MTSYLLPLVGTIACLVSGSLSIDWEGRYHEAMGELAAADSEKTRFYALNRAAKSAFEVGRLEDAREYAEELLDLAPRFERNWHYGNAIHDGHMVLGRIALREGDRDVAKRELLLAGMTPGSPQLNSFGPNVSLARDLLERDEAEVVLEYFELCGEFWESERGRLERWSVLAKAGEMPEFRANLIY